MAQQVEGEEWGHSEGSDDDDDEGGALPSRGKQRAREDTEFFDPKMDEKDERWMEKMRGGRTSDAILSCPCCLETLCLDCQRYFCLCLNRHYFNRPLHILKLYSLRSVGATVLGMPSIPRNFGLCLCITASFARTRGCVLKRQSRKHKTGK